MSLQLSPQPSCVTLGAMQTWALWTFPLLCKFSLAALPAKPENISCVYYYRKNLTCTWSPGKETSYTQYRVKRTYSYGNKSENCTTNSSTSENRASCSFFPPTVTNVDNCTIEVEAQNADGVIKSDMTYWNLDAIAKTEPPGILSVKPVLGIKRMVQIKWKRPELAPASSNLKYTLRYRTVNSTRWMEVNFTDDCSNTDQTYNLTGLQAFTEYVIALRCVAEESSFWSAWSQEEMGTSEEEAPYGLDVWRILRPAEADGRRPVWLLWKNARGAPVLENTLGYNIRYFPENNTNLTEAVNTTNRQLELHLGGETYLVSVISYNSLGESPVATLRIPALHEKFPKEGPVTKVEDIGVQTVTITWKEIPKNQRNGIISNYTIFCQAEDGKEFSKTVNSSMLQYSLESLTRKTSYTVQVMASTSAGGANGTTIKFKTLSISVFEMFLITSLTGGGLLILIILTVAYGLKKPNKLTHLCWPNVPNPAESSIATWRGDDFKDKLNLKEFDDSVNLEEDRILKPYSTPSDLIDKLVVNFENFLEDVSIEETGKSQENILGGEKNEYMTSPYRTEYAPGKSFEESLVSTEIPPRKSQHPCLRMPEGTYSEAKEQLLFSSPSLGPDYFGEEGAPNPYLKNSVTTREFLVSERLPEHTKRSLNATVA
nr:interleukin-31 receptor subunit alpha isoform X3 [Microcebus murinus]